jgi:hypothetical protein
VHLRNAAPALQDKPLVGPGSHSLCAGGTIAVRLPLYGPVAAGRNLVRVELNSIASDDTHPAAVV